MNGIENKLNLDFSLSVYNELISKKSKKLYRNIHMINLNEIFCKV